MNSLNIELCGYAFIHFLIAAAEIYDKVSKPWPLKCAKKINEYNPSRPPLLKGGIFPFLEKRNHERFPMQDNRSGAVNPGAVQSEGYLCGRVDRLSRLRLPATSLKFDSRKMLWVRA
jgi:hypothetical protein